MSSYFDKVAGGRDNMELAVSRAKEREELRNLISTKLASKTKDLNLFGIKDDKTSNKIKRWIQDIINESRTSLPVQMQKEVLDEMFLEITSLGKIHHLMEDPDISEVMVNSPSEVWIEKKGKKIKTDVVFDDNDQVMQLAKKIVSNIGRRIDNANPIVDARLPDGSRVNIVIPPITTKGVTITIRKFSKEKLGVTDMINFGTISEEAAEFLGAAVKARANIIISGGTNSGKTTTLNIVSNFVPSGERIVTIEDSLELQLNNEHVVKMEARDENAEGEGEVSIRDLIKTSLRQSPDRIIVGEVRDGSCFDLMQACNTGHDGSMGTVHANNPDACVSRMENLILQAGFDLPAKFIRQLIVEAVDIIVQIKKMKDGTRKITHITEVVKYDTEREKVITKNIYEYKTTQIKDGKLYGDFVYTGHVLSDDLMDKFENNNLNFYELVKGSEI